MLGTRDLACLSHRYLLGGKSSSHIQNMFSLLWEGFPLEKGDASQHQRQSMGKTNCLPCGFSTISLPSVEVRFCYLKIIHMHPERHRDRKPSRKLLHLLFHFLKARLPPGWPDPSQELGTQAESPTWVVELSSTTFTPNTLYL